jgi:hypothetical protein
MISTPFGYRLRRSLLNRARMIAKERDSEYPRRDGRVPPVGPARYRRPAPGLRLTLPAGDDTVWPDIEVP